MFLDQYKGKKDSSRNREEENLFIERIELNASQYSEEKVKFVYRSYLVNIQHNVHWQILEILGNGLVR